MDLLRTAVVDITTLTATCRALARSPLAGNLGARPKLRDKLRTELKRGVKAYIDTLARRKRGVLNDGLLASCRLAAECQMARALHHQQELDRLMTTTAGSLTGVAAARQDLWRLAHMAIHLRLGVAALRTSGGDRAAAKSTGSRLTRKLTRALIAYARINQRSIDFEDRMIAVARKAALSAIGTRGAAEAERLGQFEMGIGPTQTSIQMGVVKPLADLFLDWSELETPRASPERHASPGPG